MNVEKHGEHAVLEVGLGGCPSLASWISVSLLPYFRCFCLFLPVSCSYLFPSQGHPHFSPHHVLPFLFLIHLNASSCHCRTVLHARGQSLLSEGFLSPVRSLRSLVSMTIPSNLPCHIPSLPPALTAILSSCDPSAMIGGSVLSSLTPWAQSVQPAPPPPSLDLQPLLLPFSASPSGEPCGPLT